MYRRNKQSLGSSFQSEKNSLRPWNSSKVTSSERTNPFSVDISHQAAAYQWLQFKIFVIFSTVRVRQQGCSPLVLLFCHLMNFLKSRQLRLLLCSRISSLESSHFFSNILRLLLQCSEMVLSFEILFRTDLTPLILRAMLMFQFIISKVFMILSLRFFSSLQVMAQEMSPSLSAEIWFSSGSLYLVRVEFYLFGDRIGVAGCYSFQREE